MKVIFFGTGEFSTTILKGLVNAGREVVAVVSQPDKINARNNNVSLFIIVQNISHHKKEKRV